MIRLESPLRKLAGLFRRWTAPAIIVAILLAAGPSAQGAEIVNTPLRQYGWGRIWEKSLSPDGTKALLSCGDGRVRLVDAATGQVLQTLQEPGIYLASALFSPDATKALTLYGSTIARFTTPTYLRAVALWDLTNGQRLWKCDHPSTVQSLAWSPDGSRVLTGTWSPLTVSETLDCKARLIDATTGRVLGSYTGHTEPVIAVAFSPDGTRFLSASIDKTIRIYLLGSGGAPQILTNSAEVDFAFFTPDGLGVVSYDPLATKFWDLANGTVVRTLADTWALAFTPDGTGLLFGGPLYRYNNTQVAHYGLLQDCATGTTRFTLPDEVDRVLMPFSSDSSRLLNVTPDFKLQLWDTLTGEKKLETPTSGSLNNYALFTPDGSQILTYGSNYSNLGIRLLDTVTGHELRKTTFTLPANTNTFTIQAFSPDRSRFIAHRVYTPSLGVERNEHQMRDAITGEVLWTYNGDSYDSDDAAFARDGSTVLIGYNSEGRLLDAATGTLIRKLTGHAYHVLAVAISPDGTQALTGSADKTARLWDLGTGATVQTFNHGSLVDYLALSPDGMKVLTISIRYSEQCMKLWSSATGALLWSVSGVSSYGAAFSPDGKMILTCNNGEARLWDAATGQELDTFWDRFPGNYDWINSAVFSPDGKMILTGHESGAARLWKIPVPSAVGKWAGYE